jgi:hypothetical protein
MGDLLKKCGTRSEAQAPTVALSRKFNYFWNPDQVRDGGKGAFQWFINPER